MKRFFIIIFLLLVFMGFDKHVNAQNLVLNPSFEMHTCPTDGSMKDCMYWTFNDSLFDVGGVSYCSRDCPYKYSSAIPPFNYYLGYQYPHTGNNMIGLFNNYYLDTTDFHEALDFLAFHDYREFINGKLGTVLTKGALYHIGCYVNLADSSNLATDNFGIYLSGRLHHINNNGEMVSEDSFVIIPQILNPQGKLISDTLTWTLVDGIYKANGTEKYLYIGSFKDDQHSVCSRDITKYHYSGYANFYFVDDVFVERVNLPVLAPNRDTVLCPGSTITLHTSAGYNFRPQWQDGSKRDSFVVSAPGIYWVQFDTLGYTIRDSISVGYFQIMSGLPKKLVVCGFPYVLSATRDTNLTYYWPNGSTGFQYTVSKTGWVYYNLKSGKCFIKDSILLADEKKYKLILPADTSFCTNDTLVINLTDIGNNIAWQDSSSAKIYPITTPGDYKLFIITSCGNIENDMKVFVGNCPCNLWIPNAFTPDSNRLNDLFKCWNACHLDQYEMQIYNRIGLRVFQTDNIENGWDGKYNGTVCQEGIYIYYIRYQMAGQAPQTKIGNLVLMGH